MKKNIPSKQKAVRKKDHPIRFPANLLKPVGRFLQNRLKVLERRKQVVDKEDPFKDFSRVIENASPDTDAAEQFGHARSSAIKREIDKRIIQTRKALTRIKIGKYGLCEDCNHLIDTDRLMVYPEATFCAKCQAKREK